MALADLKAVAAQADGGVQQIPLSLIGGEGYLTFRATRVSDFLPKADLKNEATIAFPMLSDADPMLATNFYLMVLCYVPEMGETESPLRVFGGLMVGNPMAFMVLLGEFASRFLTTLGAAKEAAGNDSGQ